MTALAKRLGPVERTRPLIRAILGTARIPLGSDIGEPMQRI
jgi:hypothetical protein